VPEGHTVHRLADAFSAHFVGDALSASSPQGRFTEGAAVLDGRRLLGAEAWGKQMFLLFDGDVWLRVHLGMYGMWRFAGPGLAGIGRRTKGASPEDTDEEGRPP
jgi:formamidopyrimidine-DNA glycosylase